MRLLKTISLIFVAGGLAGGCYAGYIYWEKLTATIADLTNQNTSLSEDMLQAEAIIVQRDATITELIFDGDLLRDELAVEKTQNEVFAEQIRRLSGTVSTLDKLARTDRELLQKYSKVFFLSENYVPSGLTRIRDEYVLKGRDEQYFHSDAIRWLERMIRDAARDGIELRVLSAYRSFEEQTELKGQFTQIYGSGANQFSADQGYSEHQLGTAVDIVDPVTAATSQTFAKTDAYKWLLDNAYRYGFILSYPEGNSFYIFEPWHWRFVGRALANDLHAEGANFYDWEQRRIDEYLVTLFD